jgi:hypothetical protein
MKKKAPPKRARTKQKRLSPDDRRKEFVARPPNSSRRKDLAAGRAIWRGGSA